MDGKKSHFQVSLAWNGEKLTAVIQEESFVPGDRHVVTVFCTENLGEGNRDDGIGTSSRGTRKGRLYLARLNIIYFLQLFSSPWDQDVVAHSCKYPCEQNESQFLCLQLAST